jgi:hypothetical protein
MTMIDRHGIFSMGIGYTDAHLLAFVPPGAASNAVYERQALASSRRKGGSFPAHTGRQIPLSAQADPPS